MTSWGETRRTLLPVGWVPQPDGLTCFNCDDNLCTLGDVRIPTQAKGGSEGRNAPAQRMRWVSATTSATLDADVNPTARARLVSGNRNDRHWRTGDMPTVRWSGGKDAALLATG